jgi:hypothetical protein
MFELFGQSRDMIELLFSWESVLAARSRSK